MGESKNVGMAAAVAGGYALGRSKKGRLALTAAALLVGRGLSPRHMVSSGIHKLPGVPDKKSDEPEVTEEPEHHNPLARTARTVASAAANRPLTALTNALHERTLGLSGEPEPDDEAADDETADTDEGLEDDQDRDGEENEDENKEDKDDGEAAEEQPAKPRRRARAPEKSGARSPRSATERAAPRKPAASRKQAAGAKRPDRKSPPAKRAAASKDPSTKKSASRSRRER